MGPPISRMVRKDQAHHQAATFAIGQADVPAVGFGDLAGQREPEPGAVALGGLERQQGVRDHRLAHAHAAVHYVHAPASRQAAQAQGHVRGRSVGLVRVLEQVE